MTESITFAVSADLVVRLRQRASEQGVSIATVIREAVTEQLKIPVADGR
jgi:predicted DNA binding CopG/RHH family protein